MKQVAITPALMKVADKQQPAAVKDPGNFIQFLQQFSQNLEDNSANEDGVPQGDLSCAEQGNQLVDDKEDESVADSENATDTRISEANSEMTKQAEIVNEGALGWLGFFGSQMTESKGSILGGYPLQLPKEDPLVVDSVSEQSVTSVATSISVNRRKSVKRHCFRINSEQARHTCSSDSASRRTDCGRRKNPLGFWNREYLTNRCPSRCKRKYNQ